MRDYVPCNVERLAVIVKQLIEYAHIQGFGAGKTWRGVNKLSAELFGEVMDKLKNHMAVAQLDLLITSFPTGSVERALIEILIREMSKKPEVRAPTPILESRKLKLVHSK